MWYDRDATGEHSSGTRNHSWWRTKLRWDRNRGQSNPACTWALSLLSQDFLLHKGRQSRPMTWIPGEEGQERSELAGAHLKQRSQAYGEAGKAVGKQEGLWFSTCILPPNWSSLINQKWGQKCQDPAFAVVGMRMSPTITRWNTWFSSGWCRFRRLWNLWKVDPCWRNWVTWGRPWSV